MTLFIFIGFPYPSGSPALQGLIFGVWLIFLSGLALFLMELAAAWRGKRIPLLVPAIQRPVAKAISHLLIMKSTSAPLKEFKKPLLMPDLGQNDTALLPARQTEQTESDIGKSDVRTRLMQAVACAFYGPDSKLRNQKRPRIIGASVYIREGEEDMVRIVLDEAQLPPEGFTAKENIWEITSSKMLDLPMNNPQDFKLPLFFRLGHHDPDSDIGAGAFYLNLELTPAVTIRGDHIHLINYLEDAMDEMISSQMNPELRVFCVGMGYGAGESSQLMVVERLGDILPAIEKQNDSSRILVVDPFTDNMELVERLQNSTPKGVSAIMGYGKGECVLEITDIHVNLSPWGLQLLQEIPFADSSVESFVKVEPAPVGDRQHTERPERWTKRKHKPGPETETPAVEILGSVYIKNTREAFTSLQSLSLVCYLAFHRNGVTTDQLLRWLWPPDSPPARTILPNVISRARRALGNASDGRSYISYEHGIYRLSDEMKSDYEDFMDDIRKAQVTENEDEELEFLASALNRVKGVPFSVGATKSFQWSENGIRSELEYKIDNAAHRLADIAMVRGNISLAREALVKGTMCIPGCEQCIARQLVVAAKSYNLGALIEAKKDMLLAYGALEYPVPQSLLNLCDRLIQKIQKEDRSFEELESMNL